MLKAQPDDTAGGSRGTAAVVKLRRLLLGCLLAGLPGSQASAHVEMLPTLGDAGQYEVFRIRVYHGCGDLPTVSMTMKAPEGVFLVRPQVKAGWQIEAEKVQYPEPITIYGARYDSGYLNARWTGGPVPSEFMDEFLFSAFLVDRPGEKLRFLLEQRCEGKVEPDVFTAEVTLRGSEGAAPSPATSRPGRWGWVVPGSSALLAIGSIVLSLFALSRASRRG